MKTIKVTCANGHSWETMISGTKDSIKAYFIGQSFHTMPYNDNGTECRSKAVSVEFL